MQLLHKRGALSSSGLFRESSTRLIFFEKKSVWRGYEKTCLVFFSIAFLVSCSLEPPKSTRWRIVYSSSDTLSVKSNSAKSTAHPADGSLANEDSPSTQSRWTKRNTCIRKRGITNCLVKWYQAFLRRAVEKDLTCNRSLQSAPLRRTASYKRTGTCGA